MLQTFKASAPQRRRKVTSQLTYEQCSLLERAFSRAERLLLPLKTHITIHWAFAPSDIHPVDRWQRLHESANAWLRRRGVGFTWIYVWESGIQKGHGRVMHLHIAAHVPEHLIKEFRAKIVDWVKASTNPDQYQDRAVDVRWQWTLTSEWLMRYLMKGSSAKARKDFKVLAKHSPNQGQVQGKRCEVSRNLRDISWPDVGDGPVPLEKVFLRAVGK
jgi:hypothetical protein